MYLTNRQAAFTFDSIWLTRFSFYKMWIIWFSKIRFVCKALITESVQLLRLVYSILYDESCHGSTTSLSPYCLHLQVISLTNTEQWLDNANFFTDLQPIKQVLVFLGSKMYQDAIICFHTVYKYICQAIFPESLSNYRVPIRKRLCAFTQTTVRLYAN